MVESEICKETCTYVPGSTFSSSLTTFTTTTTTFTTTTSSSKIPTSTVSTGATDFEQPIKLPRRWSTTTALRDFGEAILISGGSQGYRNHTLGKSVEIWSPIIHCLLPDFEVARMGHTQEGLLACGGFADSTKGWGTCDRFDNGRWVQAYNLTNRWSHVSWATEDGVYLIGGGFGAKTSDLLKRDGTVAQGFKLPQNMQ